MMLILLDSKEEEDEEDAVDDDTDDDDKGDDAAVLAAEMQASYVSCLFPGSEDAIRYNCILGRDMFTYTSGL
jgi:hypothetical protein